MSEMQLLEELIVLTGEERHAGGDPISNVPDPVLEVVLDPGGVLDLIVGLSLGVTVAPGGVLWLE